MACAEDEALSQCFGFALRRAIRATTAVALEPQWPIGATLEPVRSRWTL